MNNQKKIINTLRNADKASVEKLMAEEAKKNEIFAKIQQRANIERSEYTDNVSGVEKYERRISMTRIASIAASAIIIAGSVGGGTAYFMNNKPVESEPNPAQSITETTTEAVRTSVAEEVTTTAETTTSAEDEQQYSITKEELIEKAKDNNFVNYFDKFSADYNIIINERREFHTEPETCIGKV